MRSRESGSQPQSSDQIQLFDSVRADLCLNLSLVRFF